jgi:glycosyltransferase involved in cell wall biosynthesis
MPAYNAGKFIRAAVESVLAQTYQALELIVVDDGSTDDTAAVVQSFGTAVHYVYQPNQRQAAARNHGIRLAKGDLIAFLDADDVWFPRKLELQTRLFLSSPQLGLVYCSMLAADPSGQVTSLIEATLRGPDGIKILLGQGSPGCGSTALVPRAVLDDVGMFDPDLSPCEDTDLFWRISVRFPVDFVLEPLVLYRLHQGNSHKDVARTTRAWTGLYAKALRDPYVRQYGWLFSRRCAGRLYYMLAGDHAKVGQLLPALRFSVQAVMHWPPMGLRIARRLMKHGETP